MTAVIFQVDRGITHSVLAMETDKILTMPSAIFVGLQIYYPIQI
jgi:hypothetical protein